MFYKGPNGRDEGLQWQDTLIITFYFEKLQTHSKLQQYHRGVSHTLHQASPYIAFVK